MKIDFSVPCSKDNLAQVRAFMNTHLDHLQLSTSDKNQIVLAVDEACANAIIHGNHCDDHKELKIELEIINQQLWVEIYDVGKYSPKKIFDFQEKDITENIRKRDKGGLGLHIMYSVMDNVKYYSKDDINVCCLTKTLK